MDDLIVVMPYDPVWPDQFQRLGRQLRAALGNAAVRIDHIGSTAIPGMSAKPILDVQISVAALEPMSIYKTALEGLGFAWRPDNPDRTKRYFREPPGTPRTHIHVRQAGSLAEQLALVFRDYLRTHPEESADYTDLKKRLAQQFRKDRDGYIDAKGPFVWKVMQRATDWSQSAGWQPGPSDA